MEIPNNIVDYFNPTDIYHIKAYKYLTETGAWPEGYFSLIPAKVEFPAGWQIKLAQKMAKEWVEYFINDKKKPKTFSLEIKEIFEFWNSLKIILHRDIESCSSEIEARLNFYSVNEIKEAIENYATILHSKDYVFSYRWPLKDFLARKKDNIARFMNSSKSFESFQKTKNYYWRKEAEKQTQELEALDREEI